MATFANITDTVARPQAPGIRALLDRAAAWLARERLRGQMIRELNNHTDRQLADMGLARADIRAIARGTFRR